MIGHLNNCDSIMYFDLTDIKLFTGIADSGSLTRAAEHSNMSAPAASIRIKHIEDRLGTKLLYRTGHGVTLTPAGQAFLHHGRLVLNQLERLQGDLQEYVHGLKGQVRIFANTTSTAEFLPAALSRYLATHPDVNVELQERVSYDIVRGVRQGSADIGIVSGAVCTDELEVIPYKQYRLVLVVAPHHPLAQRKTIRFEETLDFGYVGLSEETAIQTFLNAAARDTHKSLRIRIRVGNFESVCRMVERNVGIGVLPEPAARRYASNTNIRIKLLSDNWAVCNLKICVRDLQSLPVLAKELIDVLIARGAGRSLRRRVEHPR